MTTPNEPTEAKTPKELWDEAEKQREIEAIDAAGERLYGDKVLIDAALQPPARPAGEAEEPMQVAIEDILAHQQWRQRINAHQPEDIEFTYKGKIVGIPADKLRDFSFTGLSTLGSQLELPASTTGFQVVAYMGKAEWRSPIYGRELLPAQLHAADRGQDGK